MDRIRSLPALAAISVLWLAACGSGSDNVAPAPEPVPTPPAPPPPGITDADRIAAATQTVATNTMCSEATLGPYYWEVGDASGSKVSGTVSASGPTASTVMWVFSSSKWLYAANVVQKRQGALDPVNDVPYLNFTSGYSKYGNPPVCVVPDTVDTCFVGHDGTQDPATIGLFDYDTGHMQHHASAILGIGSFDDAALAADLNSTLGGFDFNYKLPQLAAGVLASPQSYAEFLRKLLRGDLLMAAALGTNKVCAQTAAAGCNAAFTPSGAGTEAWNYSLGHWVEDDPVVGDHAFSSPGGGGFYPWIDATKTYYGLVARDIATGNVADLEEAAGFHSAECGRLVRQAWMTGTVVTSTTPTPSQ